MPHVIAEVRQNAAANADAVAVDADDADDADNHHVIATDDDYGDRMACVCLYVCKYVCKHIHNVSISAPHKYNWRLLGALYRR